MSDAATYLYCGVCYLKANSCALYLTSCAHVLCQEHVNLNSRKCGKCLVNDISIIKLEKNLNNIPENIKEIIEPSYEQLNNIQFANKFQHLQMKELIIHQDNEIVILKSKNNRLKELLKKSRIELDKCNEYQKEISRLREENERLNLKLQIGDNTSSRSIDKILVSDELNEITFDEYNNNNNNNFSNNNNNNKNIGNNLRDEDFVSKMRKFSQINKYNSETNRKIESRKDRDKENNRDSGFTSFNIQAESTNKSFRNKDRSMSMQITPLKRINSNSSNIGGAVTSTSGADTRVSSSIKGYEWYKNRGTNSNNNNNNIINIEKNDKVNNAGYIFQFKPPSRNHNNNNNNHNHNNSNSSGKITSLTNINNSGKSTNNISRARSSFGSVLKSHKDFSIRKGIAK